MNEIKYFKIEITSGDLIEKIKNYARVICWAEAGLSDTPSLGTIRIMCSDRVALDATMTRYELSCMVHENLETMYANAEAPLAYSAMQTVVEALLANYKVEAIIDGIEGKEIDISIIYADMLKCGYVYTEDDIDEICDDNAITPITNFKYKNGVRVNNGAEVEVVENYSHYE
jgi:hypothetical protein